MLARLPALGIGANLMSPITFLTYKWKPKPGYHSNFNGEHVNVLARMVERNFKAPHRFVCYTDDKDGIDRTLVDARDIWDDHKDLAVFARSNPSAFRRLKMYARDAADWLGERIFMMDLDIVITGHLTPVLDRPEDFVINAGVVPFMPYNSALILFSAGARPQLWEAFDPVESLAFARSKGQPHTDDGWIGAKLGPNEATFGPKNGVYSFEADILGKRDTLPANAAIVNFCGKNDPDGPLAQSYDWVRENYR